MEHEYVRIPEYEYVSIPNIFQFGIRNAHWNPPEPSETVWRSTVDSILLRKAQSFSGKKRPVLSGAAVETRPKRVAAKGVRVRVCACARARACVSVCAARAGGPARGGRIRSAPPLEVRNDVGGGAGLQPLQQPRQRRPRRCQRARALRHALRPPTRQ